MSKVERLKRELDDLILRREDARRKIDPVVEGFDKEYQALERAVNKAYRALMKARDDGHL